MPIPTTTTVRVDYIDLENRIAEIWGKSPEIAASLESSNDVSHGVYGNDDPDAMEEFGDWLTEGGDEIVGYFGLQYAVWQLHAMGELPSTDIMVSVSW